MNDKQKNALYVAGAVAVILLLKTFFKKDGNVLVNMDDGQSSPFNQRSFEAPFLTTNPGIPDWDKILNGGDTFNSVTNLMVNPSMAMQLNTKYIPLFGFVGVSTYSQREIQYVDRPAKKPRGGYDAMHVDVVGPRGINPGPQSGISAGSNNDFTWF